MNGQKGSAECRRLLALYGRVVGSLAKAVAAAGESALSYEVEAFERTWQLCDDLQARCREIHRQLQDSFSGPQSAKTATLPKSESFLIADNQAVFRHGLRRALAEEFPGARVGETREGMDALIAVTARPWSIVILHVARQDRKSSDLLGEILRQKPQTRVLVLLDKADDPNGGRYLQLGAYGCLAKDSSPVELTRALRGVLTRSNYVRRNASPKLSSGSRTLPGNTCAGKALSDRERQIAVELVAGKTPTETARDLQLSVKTISTYKRRILNKLQLDSIAELVRYAIDHKLS